MSASYGDPNRLQDNQHTASGYESAGAVMAERFLIQDGPNADAAGYKPTAGYKHTQLISRVAPLILMQNFANVDVIGVSLYPFMGGTAIRTYHSGTFGGQTQLDTSGRQNWWIIDFVFRLTASDWHYASEDGLAALLSAHLSDWAGSSPIATFLALSPMAPGVRNGGVAEANDFWSKQPTLIKIAGGQVAGFSQEYKAADEKKTFGKQLAFGLSDYPNALEPVTWSTDVLQPGDGKTPQIPWSIPGGSNLPVPQKGTSATNMLVWVTTAALGFYAARTIWDRYRR